MLRTKEEKDHPDCYQQQVQKPGSVMVWGCVSALGKGNLHFCDGTINAEKYIEILEHNMLPSRRHLFQGRPCIFQQDNAKPHSAHITKSWLRRKRVRVLDWQYKVYLQMTWSWPDKTWNILCSYCLQWNTSQSKFRNHYFLFLFAFSILSQLFLIWGCSTEWHGACILYNF